MDYNEAKKLVLKDKRVVVRPVGTINTTLVNFSGAEDHDGAFMYSEASATIQLGFSVKERSLKKFLTAEQREAFEILLQKNPGDLSFYKEKDNYWRKFKVVLDKHDFQLDLSDPMGALTELFLLADDKICKWEERENRPGAKWGIVDFEVSNKAISEIQANKIKANVLFSELIKEAGTDKLSNVLSLLGRKVAVNSTKEHLQIELYKIIETTTNIKGKANIKDFIRVMETPSFSEEVDLENFINYNLIGRNKTKYTLKETGDSIGNNKKEALEWVKDIANSTTIRGFKERIKEIKKG